LVEQLKAFGQAAAVPALLASRASVPREPDVFEVWPENAESVRFFLLCCRQWIIAPMGGYLSLSWPSIDIALNRLKPADPDAIFADLIEMEAAALPILNEPRPRE
jgi:hypothetical protein